MVHLSISDGEQQIDLPVKVFYFFLHIFFLGIVDL